MSCGPFHFVSVHPGVLLDSSSILLRWQVMMMMFTVILFGYNVMTASLTFSGLDIFGCMSSAKATSSTKDSESGVLKRNKMYSLT